MVSSIPSISKAAAPNTIPTSSSNLQEQIERIKSLVQRAVAQHKTIIIENKSNGVPCGKGILIYPDGRIYRGSIAERKPHGEGRLIFPIGSEYEMYVGRFANGYCEGQGTLTFSDRRVYQGRFKRNQFNGEGIAIYPDGSKYIGEFLNGLFHGKGRAEYPNRDVYEGEFKDGKKHGDGALMINFAKKSIKVSYREGILLRQCIV